MAKIVKPERVLLKGNPELSEKQIQDFVFKDPSILGLGDLTAIQKERTQPSGGRLDLLLADDINTRYEVELQLGETDPSHIIRTIEYWDTERKRYPNYDHCAVIIAEVITGRFLNVISLFNGAIPLIALQMSAFKSGDNEVSLVFTKVMDRVILGTEEEETLEQTDRKYWEKKSTPKMLTLMDEILKSIPEMMEGFVPKYNKFYIGLSKDGIARNFISFKPKKNYLWLQAKCPQNEELSAAIEDAGLEINFDNRWRQYSIRINHINEYLDQKEIIDELLEFAKENFNI